MTPLSLLYLLAAGALVRGDEPAKAKEETPKVPSATVVVATKTERLDQETPATVTALDQEAMEARQAQRLPDLVRYEPGLSVGRKPDRQGATSFNIRGIDENRVLVLVDGVKVPDGPASGHSFSRDLVDLGALKRVEILRGPGSALFGSDALGGVVSYTTKDASELLAQGSTFGGGFRTSFDGADRSQGATATAAGRQGSWDGLVLATRREGHELTPALGGANPLDIRTTDLLGKMSYRRDVHTFRFQAGALRRETEARLLSSEGSFNFGPSPTLISGAHGEDEQRRSQFSFIHQWEDASRVFERVETRVYRQEARTDERSSERRTTSGVQRDREGLSRFEQGITGLSIQGEARALGEASAHRLTLGLDASRTDTSRPRWKTETNRATGTSSTTVGGESFPNKVFPDTTTDRIGLYVQDEWALGERWSLIPGLRWDRTRMSPRPDAESDRSNTLGAVVKGYDLNAVSPKMSVLSKLGRAWSAYAQYAEGFRTPPYDDANLAFTNFASRYTVLPNGDLKSEHSRGVEIGVKAEAQGDRFALALFQNTYRDFIDTVAVVPPPASVPAGFLAFQSRNLTSVRIRGVEAKGALGLGDFTLAASAAWAEGDDLEHDRPLDGVEPAKAVLGLAWRAEGDVYGVEGVLSGVARKTRTSSPTAFRTPGYGTVDLMAHWRATRWLKLQAGVFNAFDRVTWAWSDVRGQQEGSAVLSRYTQPGRTWTVSLTAAWK